LGHGTGLDPLETRKILCLCQESNVTPRLSGRLYRATAILRLYVCLFACLFVCLFACLFACLFVCLFVCFIGIRNSIKSYLNLIAKIILIMRANEMHYFSNLFDKVLYTCFGQVHCPSSGVSQHCIHAIGICHACSVDCLLAWSSDSQQNLPDKYLLRVYSV
jgi:hypothetical protein